MYNNGANLCGIIADNLTEKSSMEKERLIELVRARPALWDHRRENYRKREDRQRQWEEVAAEMNTSSERIKRMWECLRDIFRRELKKRHLNLRSDMNNGLPRKQPRWKYFSAMFFLKNAIMANDAATTSSSSPSMMASATMMSSATTSATGMMTSATTTSTTAAMMMMNNGNKSNCRNLRTVNKYSRNRQNDMTGGGGAGGMLPIKQEIMHHEDVIVDPMMMAKSVAAAAAATSSNFTNDYHHHHHHHQVSAAAAAAAAAATRLPIDVDGIVVVGQRVNETTNVRYDENDVIVGNDVSGDVIGNVLDDENDHDDVDDGDDDVVDDVIDGDETNCGKDDRNVSHENPSSSLLQDYRDRSYEDDDDYHFVMSILPSLREIRSSKKLWIRMAIMKIISDELNDYQNEAPSTTATSTSTAMTAVP